MERTGSNGELIMIAAPHKMGKTPLGLSLFSLGFMHWGENIHWISPKMKKSEVKDMLVRHLSIKIFGDYENSQIRREFILQFMEVFDIEKKIIEFHSEDNICSFFSQFAQPNSANLPDYIIIDDFKNLIQNNSSNINSRIVELKKIANDLTIKIIVLYECNFPNNMGEKFDYSNIKLDFDCELVDSLCFLYRPEYYRIPFYPNGESTLGDASFLVYKNNQLMCEYLMKYDPLNFRFY
ncbi:MAG: hypothetical protein EOM47_10610 [Bacteroidia bacterium]|nr:hypothetical protein [Bacteroidia bacterium]